MSRTGRRWRESLGDICCIETVPLLFKLLGGDVLILGRVKGHGTVHYESVVAEPRGYDDDTTGTVEANLAEWLAGRCVGLDVPRSDSVVEIPRIGNHDVSVHGKCEESPI